MYRVTKQTTPMEDISVSKPRSFIGLCSTCNNVGTCVYRRRRGYDALYCEMFDGSGPQRGNGNSDADAVVVTTSTIAADKVTNTEPKGLCVNCKHRDTCKLNKPESGVWHCEEYE